MISAPVDAPISIPLWLLEAPSVGDSLSPKFDVIRLLDQREEPVVFLLWGNNAKAKRALIQHPQHLVLTAAHPSPLSAYHGFFGCKHFSKANAFLREHGLPEIDWSI